MFSYFFFFYLSPFPPVLRQSTACLYELEYLNNASADYEKSTFCMVGRCEVSNIDAQSIAYCPKGPEAELELPHENIPPSDHASCPLPFRRLHVVLGLGCTQLTWSQCPPSSEDQGDISRCHTT